MARDKLQSKTASIIMITEKLPNTINILRGLSLHSRSTTGSDGLLYFYCFLNNHTVDFNEIDPWFYFIRHHDSTHDIKDLACSAFR